MPFFQSGLDHEHHIEVMILTAGLMFLSFALGQLVGRAFPPVDGRPQSFALFVSRACLVVLTISGFWFVSTATADIRLMSALGL